MSRNRELANLIAGGFTEADIPNLSASKITSGTLADARISSSSVSQHATSFDDNKIVNDLSTLGLRVHTQENLIASNSNSASFDVFQDSSAISNLTNVTRNDSEYISSMSSSAGTPTTTADDILLLESYGHSDNEDNFVDASSGGVGATGIDHTGNYYYSTTQSLSGVSTSIYARGTSADAMYNQTNSPSSTAISNLPSETNYTLEFWIYPLSSENYSTNQNSVFDVGRILQFEYNASEELQIYNAGNSNDHANLGTLTKDQWHHVAYVKQGSTYYAYLNGVQKGTGTAYSSNFTDNFFRVMYHRSSGSRHFKGFMDLIRITKRAVYPDGTSFTSANVWNYTVLTASATGSFTGNNITAPSSVSKMGAVITYQDASGTNALNTDIVLKLSADNGSNYSTATLTALPDFATGIKMAKINDLSVTAGTQLKYKIEFANQSSGSKEARIRGVSLQY